MGGSGVAAGFGIGVVAAITGVAGGELLIPTIVLLFGEDIKTAGSLSLLVSLPNMLVAFARYSRDDSFAVLGANFRFAMITADRLEELRDLLAAGADIHEEYNGFNLLHRAVDGEIDGHIQTGEPLHDWERVGVPTLRYSAAGRRLSRTGVGDLCVGRVQS
ncbi:hypothetical protein ACFVRD_47410 [Streptomyces sp. NPDC057908]|uniref:hypothetical protein n=1 Tax=Streptomyces sp. NPDC057908 TaxID=3346276 RepID=UPI0036F0367F